MDFIDVLKQFSVRTERMYKQIQTEEATKTSLIMPFFQQVFGYDVFNPDEFVPEFTADVGIKKGEKVDYAIFLDKKPAILIEAKWCGVALEKHDSQLFRYFGTTKAKIGILTNGLVYKFYTDLEEKNKMDLKPFLELDLLDLKDGIIPELKQFCKTNYNEEEVFSRASELKYSNEIRSYFTAQLKDPDDDFVKFMLAQAYEGVKTQAVIERFKPVIKSTLNNLISEMMNERITSALKTEAISTEPLKPNEDVAVPADEKLNKISTTQEELEALGIIKGLLFEVVDPNLLSYKDTERYFAVLFDGKVTKWICRLVLTDNKKELILPTVVTSPYDMPAKQPLTSVNDLYSHKSILIASLERFLAKNIVDDVTV
jgi:hypothetical protein